MRTCSKCNQTKSDDNFRANGKDRQCKQCKADYQRELRRSGYRPSGRNKKLASMDPSDREVYDTMSVRRTDIRNRIRRYNLVGETPDLEVLTSLWLFQQGKCALTGRPMSLESGSPWVVSVDKRDPALGYSVSNMQLSCWAANRAKGDLTHDEFVDMCRDVAGLGSGLPR